MVTVDGHATLGGDSDARLPPSPDVLDVMTAPVGFACAQAALQTLQQSLGGHAAQASALEAIWSAPTKAHDGAAAALAPPACVADFSQPDLSPAGTHHVTPASPHGPSADPSGPLGELQCLSGITTATGGGPTPRHTHDGAQQLSPGAAAAPSPAASPSPEPSQPQLAHSHHAYAVLHNSRPASAAPGAIRVGAPGGRGRPTSAVPHLAQSHVMAHAMAHSRAQRASSALASRRPSQRAAELLHPSTWMQQQQQQQPGLHAEGHGIMHAAPPSPGGSVVEPAADDETVHHAAAQSSATAAAGPQADGAAAARPSTPEGLVVSRLHGPSLVGSLSATTGAVHHRRPHTALQPRNLRPGSVRYWSTATSDPFLAMDASGREGGAAFASGRAVRPLTAAGQRGAVGRPWSGMEGNTGRARGAWPVSNVQPQGAAAGGCEYAVQQQRGAGVGRADVLVVQ